ncbi:MAG: hypothetical protein Q8O14_13770 [bacterium]|jgi:hypothetical protein|nr:hypothetical protein [bacterium]
MTSKHDETGGLERLVAESAIHSFRPGFAGRVLARLEAERRTAAEVNPFWQWTWRLFPAAGTALFLLAAGLAAWNLAAQPEGVWLDRLLNLPAETLENGLVAQLEDWS